MDNYRQNNRARVKEILETLNHYEDERQKLHDGQQKYYKMMNKASQYQLDLKKVLDQAEDGQKSQKDIDGFQRQTLKLKHQAQESENSYKQQIQSLNEFQSDFKVKYKSFFEQFDINEQSRIIFTKTTIFNLIKYQTQFAVNFAKSDLFDEQKFKQLDDLYKDYLKINTFKTIVTQEGQSDNNFLEQIQPHEFVSYDQHLKTTTNYPAEPMRSLANTQLLTPDAKARIDKIISDLLDDAAPALGLLARAQQLPGQLPGQPGQGPEDQSQRSAKQQQQQPPEE